MAGSRVPAFFVGARNRFVNGAVPGNVFDARGNYMGNGGRAAIATGLKLLANAFVPGTGLLVDRGLSGWVNRGADYGIGGPVMEQVDIPGAPSSSRAFTAPTPSQMTTQNLGLGVQRPGGNWFGYTGGAGSTGSFGNNQIGNGMATVGQWSPQSVWGQSIAADPGSNINFGNYSPGATATGAVRGGGGARSTGNGGRIVGGNSAGDSGGARSAFWRRAYQQD